HLYDRVARLGAGFGHGGDLAGDLGHAAGRDHGTRQPPRANMSSVRRTTRLPWMSLQGAVVLIYGFILGPILITATVSFNATNRSIFPPQALSFHWWGEALDAKWTGPILFSIGLAGATALLAIAIGIPVAFALVRREFRGKRALELLTIGPLILPALVTGI